MKSRLFCNPVPHPQVSNRLLRLFAFGLLTFAWGASLADASDSAPAWMHAASSVPAPPHDEKTDAVLLYSERNVTVFSAEKIRIQTREVYKILRPGGRGFGTVAVYFTLPGQKVTSLHGWSMPAQGADFSVKDKEAVEVSAPATGGELVSDVRVKLLRIPAAEPGNIVGYEYEVEKRPLLLQDDWQFQETSPVAESHYSLQLPPGWEYRSAWLNYAECKPAQAGANQWQWALKNVSGIRREEEMPPVQGVAGRMVVSFFPAGGPDTRNGFSDWRGMGNWYQSLLEGRLDASPEIKQKVASLTASLSPPLQKMRVLANVVQHDVRYVAIELGIGGYQPHPASEVFTHHYGDCKDKATLMQSMLREIGIDSYFVLINAERGTVKADTPADGGAFNHVILAVKLPVGLTDPSLIATIDHPRLGKILFFDPTNDLTPFGRIGGYLQSNYGLLVAPGGGELVELPKEPSIMNSVVRMAKLKLDESGRLHGDVREIRVGDRATRERGFLRNVPKDSDKIKPIESILGGSLSNFHITKARIENLNQTDQPFGFDYSFDAEDYAKNAGDLLLLRPRAIGVKSSGLLETKEPRLFPIEFEGPERDTDSFEITVPAGYEVEDLPPPVAADYSFAAYHSKSEVVGNVIHYNRTFEIKELSVPVSKAADLKALYRIIATDERNTAVLKHSAK